MIVATTNSFTPHAFSAVKRRQARVLELVRYANHSNWLAHECKTLTDRLSPLGGASKRQRSGGPIVSLRPAI
jgi:hypothetical protein